MLNGLIHIPISLDSLASILAPKNSKLDWYCFFIPSWGISNSWRVPHCFSYQHLSKRNSFICAFPEVQEPGWEKMSKLSSVESIFLSCLLGSAVIFTLNTLSFHWHESETNSSHLTHLKEGTPNWVPKKSKFHWFSGNSVIRVLSSVGSCLALFMTRTVEAWGNRHPQERAS